MKPKRMFALVNWNGDIIEVAHYASVCRDFAIRFFDEPRRPWSYYYRRGWRVIPVIVRPA